MMGLDGFLRRFLGQERGVAAVEFALLAPVLIVMLGGLYEAGAAFQAMTAANGLASQYAISWADCQDNPLTTCQTEMNTLYAPTAAISNVAPQLVAANVKLQMFQVNMNGTTPTPTYSYSSSGGATMSAAQTAAAQASLTSGQNGVVVTVTYTYTVSMPGLVGIFPASFPMTFTVVQLKA